MAFIRAHFEINRCIRNLKADLGVVPSSDAKTALMADFQSLEMNPGGGWWGIPQRGGLHENSPRQKSTRPVPQIQTRNEEEVPPGRKALDAAMQAWGDANA
jgi:2-phospho-L-lactate transferase/gluconeogenesis factor (CofD/UPF0052 family)